MNNTSLIRSSRQVGAGGAQEAGATMATVALRWSGVALVAAAIVLGTAIALASLRLPGTVPPMPLGSLLLLVGSMLLMLALPGMYARQAEAAGALGLVGHVLLAVGNVALIGFATAPLFNPSVTGLDKEETIVAGLLLLVLPLGFVLTAVATLRAAVYPRWSAILLLAVGVEFLLTFFGPEGLPPIAGQLIGVSWGVSLTLALAWIGVALLRGADQRAP
jgi:hypothetical protein